MARVVERIGERIGHIADENGLETCAGVGNRKDRGDRREHGKRVEELVLRSEHDRGLKDGPVERRGAHGGFAVAFAALVHRRTVRIRSERAHVEIATHAQRFTTSDDATRQLDMRAGELGAVGRSARTLQDADQIEHRIATSDQSCKRRVVMDVGFDHVDCRQRDQMARSPPPAYRNRDLQPAVDEPADDVSADEAGSADDQDVGMLHGGPEGGDCEERFYSAGSGLESGGRHDTRSRQLGGTGRLGCDGAEALFQRLRLVLEQGRVVDAVRHDLLHIVARLVEWNRLGKDRAFDRPLQ